jgi:hypothetical protein
MDAKEKDVDIHPSPQITQIAVPLIRKNRKIG